MQGKWGILKANAFNPGRENTGDSWMADLDAVLEQLKRERKRSEGELKQLDKVIAALSKMRTTGSPSDSSKDGKRQLSAAARERIAAAQRARWAKVRAQSKKSS